jgi:hypothetical protein
VSLLGILIGHLVSQARGEPWEQKANLIDQLACRGVLLRIPADNRCQQDRARMQPIRSGGNRLHPAVLLSSCISLVYFRHKVAEDDCPSSGRANTRRRHGRCDVSGSVKIKLSALGGRNAFVSEGGTGAKCATASLRITKTLRARGYGALSPPLVHSVCCKRFSTTEVRYKCPGKDADLRALSEQPLRGTRPCGLPNRC